MADHSHHDALVDAGVGSQANEGVAETVEAGAFEVAGIVVAQVPKP